MLPHRAQRQKTPAPNSAPETWRPWFDAWIDAAYGVDSFWASNRPNEHFRTPCSSGGLVAEMVASLLAGLPAVSRVIDVGAGNGDLLGQLGLLRPDLDLAGIDLRDRPDRLPGPIRWAQDCWDVRYGCWTTGAAEHLAAERRATVLICSEWLDDLPCPVVRAGADGWRAALVDDSGREQLGQRLDPAELAWSRRWWPEGDRAEIGATRDTAWQWVLGAAGATPGGAALMIDYGHLADARPPSGSFTGYRAGRQVEPVPASDLNLTAHVAVDSVRAAGEALGARTSFCCLQSEAVGALVPRADQGDPLKSLIRRSQQHALSSHYVWGTHWWLLQHA